MNILLVTADSLRVDRTSFAGCERNTTPFLAEFAEEAFEFKTAYASGTNTATSFPAMLTSRYQCAYEGYGIPKTGPPTLAECLAEAEFDTFGMHTNELISSDYNYDRGFDVYKDSRSQTRASRPWRSVGRRIIGNGALFEVVKRLHFITTEHLGVKVFDTANSVSGFTTPVVKWVDAREENWFVWVHSMNPHHPYEPPDDIQRELGFDPIPNRRATRLSRKMRLNPEKVTAEERDAIGRLYDASVLSFDREVDSLIKELDSIGGLEEALTIVTSDHGEMLGEDNLYGHPPRFDQPLIRVPLLIDGPVPGRSTDRPVSLLDLSPTILELVGTTSPDPFVGQPLFDTVGVPIDGKTDRDIIIESHNQDHSVCCIRGDRKVAYDHETASYTYWKLNQKHTEATRVQPHGWEDLEAVLEDHCEWTERNRGGAAMVDQERLEEDLAALGYLTE